MGAFFDCFIDIREVGAEAGNWVDDTCAIGAVLRENWNRERCTSSLTVSASRSSTACR